MRMIRHVRDVAALLCVACLGCQTPGTGDGGADAAPVDAARPPLTAASQDYPTGIAPTYVAAGDLDGDGRIDLVVTSAGTTATTTPDGGVPVAGTVGVLLNQGSGAYAARVDYPTGVNPNSVVLGDFDGDGKLDAVVANYGSATVSVFINQGQGKLGPKVDYPTGAAGKKRLAHFAKAGDFDGDGKLDLAVVNGGTDGNMLSVLTNLGAGVLGPPVDYPTGKNPACVEAGDVDGDGKTDIVVGNYKASTLSVYRNLGTGLFAPKVDYPVGTPISIALGDLDGDSQLDVAVAGWQELVNVLLNQGAGVLGKKTDYYLGNYSTPLSVALGDLDGDGKTDLAVANYDEKRFSLFFNQGKGAFSSPLTYKAVSPYALVAADLDGDGKPDLAMVNHLDDTLSVVLNQGTFKQP